MSAPSALTITVPASLHDQRLDQILAASVPGLSRNEARRLIARGGVRLSGPNRGRASERLAAGQKLEVELEALDDRSPEERVHLARTCADIQLLAHGDTWAVVRKPAGLGSTARHLGDRLCLAVAARARICALLPAWRVHVLDDGGLVHRLDHGTSGVSLFARDAQAHVRFIVLRRRGELQRTYWAIVRGVPPAEGTITYPIAHASADARRMVALITGHEAHRGASQPARSVYQRLASHGDASLLELHLHGGRRHQLRVHLAGLGHPILGDELYGAPPAPRLALHALALRVPDARGSGRVIAEPGEHFWAFAPALTRPTPPA